MLLETFQMNSFTTPLAYDRGFSLQKFGYIESYNLDIEPIFDILMNGHCDGKILYIARNGIPKSIAQKSTLAFDKELLKSGNSRTNDGYVKNHQIGATQFAKSGREYSDSVAQLHASSSSLFSHLEHDEIDILFQQSFLENGLIKKGIHFGPARFKNAWPSFATFRRWLDNGKMSLWPHEDQAQLAFASKDNYEIYRGSRVIAYNACLECSGSGGELRIWNLLPYESFRTSLGLGDTGYPYPLEQIEGIEQLSVKLEAGDLYFLNASFLHGVSSVHGGQRLTAGRFMTPISTSKIVFWT